MKVFKPAMLFLEAQLYCIRLGWMNGITSIAFLAAVLVGGWSVSFLQTQVEATQAELLTAQHQNRVEEINQPSPPLSRSEQNLQQFRETLGDARYAEQQVKMLFGIARKTGLSLNTAEYKFVRQKAGAFQTYQANFPVTGPYDAIRTFCEQVLLATPFSSLDEVNFKRDAISNAVLEANIRITFYLSETSDASDDRAFQRNRDSQELEL